MMVSGAKRTLDNLFLLHASISCIIGATLFIFPHFAELFLIHQDNETVIGLTDHTAGDAQKITHLVLRLYGALVLGQGHLVLMARDVADAPMRKVIVRVYAITFGLTAVALLRAQTTEGGSLNGYNWINIVVFAWLSAFYAWFVLVQPIAIFESLDKVSL
ncbi:hypothetical protein SARC_05231 [Sphaeroforma arctica JP610]|uniref:Intimal thickness related receptor IRP domain-containing protein n=1 Tax=Sphaeroforma arctica JP610 TaxID=667725 RepID=A0A0L0G0V6_9EUKA|nr:hypothetical protein SARC_05231 [Sphaeroforma arctica JP610]KNC82479.1 hypothetical protein SARC_05231 [Sphaeroforma arctica JP610]|eukprot:XP_014156381.1 hypothetical protein SARC_05231 [Sphaeroforma arctica JP610]